MRRSSQLSKAGEDHSGCHLVPLLGRCRESCRRPMKMEMREGWVRMTNTESLSDLLAQGDWVTTPLATTLLLVGIRATPSSNTPMREFNITAKHHTQQLQGFIHTSLTVAASFQSGSPGIILTRSPSHSHKCSILHDNLHDHMFLLLLFSY